MSYLVSVLDVYAEKVKDILRQEFLSSLYPVFEIHFAGSYGREEQLALARDADFLVVGWPEVDAEMLGQAKNLKVIHKWGVGCDNIDLRAAASRGIGLYITAGSNAVPVSELALLLMLTLLRRLPFADRNMRNGKWMKSEMRESSQHLTHKRVGIVGMGNIGCGLVNLLKGFQVEIGYYDVFRKNKDVENTLGIEYKPFEELLSWSQILSLHIPLTTDTHHIIDAKALELMDREALLINTARGRLVDQAALIDALQNKKIAGAGLDVFEQEPLAESPLLYMENVVLTPHMGGATLNNVSAVARHIKHNLIAYATHEISKIKERDIIAF